MDERQKLKRRKLAFQALVLIVAIGFAIQFFAPALSRGAGRLGEAAANAEMGAETDAQTARAREWARDRADADLRKRYCERNGCTPR